MDIHRRDTDTHKQLTHFSRLREAKECEVYIVLTPEYEGRPNGKSLPVYNRMGKVSQTTVFLFKYMYLYFMLIKNISYNTDEVTTVLKKMTFFTSSVLMGPNWLLF